MQAVELLLDFGADANCRFCGTETAVYVAAEHGHTNIVKVLLKKKSTRKIGDPNSISEGKNTPLFIAKTNSNQDMMILLLTHNATISVIK